MLQAKEFKKFGFRRDQRASTQPSCLVDRNIFYSKLINQLGDRDRLWGDARMTDFANFIAWALIVMTPLMGAAALTMREIFIGDGAWIMAGALCAVAVAILLYTAVLIARRSAAPKEHIVIWLD